MSYRPVLIWCEQLPRVCGFRLEAIEVDLRRILQQLLAEDLADLPEQRVVLPDGLNRDEEALREHHHSPELGHLDDVPLVLLVPDRVHGAPAFELLLEDVLEPRDFLEADELQRFVESLDVVVFEGEVGLFGLFLAGSHH